jgi:hypothetical protein
MWLACSAHVASLQPHIPCRAWRAGLLRATRQVQTVHNHDAWRSAPGDALPPPPTHHLCRLGLHDMVVDPCVRLCYSQRDFLLVHGPRGEGFQGRTWENMEQEQQGQQPAMQSDGSSSSSEGGASGTLQEEQQQQQASQDSSAAATSAGIVSEGSTSTGSTSSTGSSSSSSAPDELRELWAPGYVPWATSSKGDGYRQLGEQLKRGRQAECCPIRPDNDQVEFAKCGMYDVYSTNFTEVWLQGQQQQQVQ